MSESLVVIGTSPAQDTSVVVGVYRSSEKALEASSDLEALGYVTEICPVVKVEDVQTSEGWDGA